MLFLSKLAPNLRNYSVRRGLENPYELHRTLLRAFPAADAGGAGRVLFRVEVPRGDVPSVLVQSVKEPDWSRLPEGYLTECQVKSLDGLAFFPGQRLAFRLRANPTKRLGRSATDPQWAGKRVGLWRDEDQANWLAHKGQEGGFRVREGSFRAVAEGKLVARKAGLALQFQAVRFEGILEVTDPDRFSRTLADGVGCGKGLGFGLLSVGLAPG